MTKSMREPAADRRARIKSSTSRQRAQPAGPAASADTALSRKRKDLKGIAIYMHPIAKRTLDKIAYEHDKSVQELGLEALNLLFTQYGERPLA